MRYEPDFGRGWLKREFGRELRDFWHFIRHPHLSPRRRRPGDWPIWLSDWLPACPWRLLVCWLVFLWLISAVVLGPVIILAADASGAEHKMGDLGSAADVPLLLGIVVAPLCEELVFRYGLRRFGHLFWMVPLGVLAVVVMARLGVRANWYYGAFALALVVLGSCCAVRFGARPGRWGWRWRRWYVRCFGLVFHVCALTFAGVHLLNYKLADVSWFMPLLVCSQWLGGMVMGWLRVTRSLGSSILLHAGFNAGPMLLLWSALKLWPDLGE